ncbi:peptidoglycan D,D-transpeptidase FtsI family protein [Rhabdothermincola salaria]|uniref:peptidoglycan D,D-transpeptidase FtsI family protein n=1 Tax=Rhabdothermincola salaria TaxID=2903142 RepID=UPI001E3341BC|nr:penicillin-binding protein 2 [Rhabdothermincola salaria]
MGEVLSRRLAAVPEGGRRRRAARRSVHVGAGAPPDHRRRLLAVLAVVGLLFAIVASKVIDLQVLNPDRHLAWGVAQRFDTTVLAADRGAILDRNGAELAVSRPTRSVFVDPELIEEPAVAASAVAPLLGLDVDEVTAEMAGEGRFAYLARKVSADVADRIAALGLAGVAFLDESERYLPAGDSARSLLGQVDVDNQGISGLEAQFGDVLTGTPGEIRYERTPEGQTIAVGERDVVPAVPGDDLMLTLDRSIQFEAERLLAEQVAAVDAQGGIAIVSRPETGEILAMANVVRDPDSDEVVIGTNNAALTTQYEPGSVMKPVTIGAALEDGHVEPGSELYLPSTLPIYDYEIQEAEPRGPVTWDVSQILADSSNVGTVKIGQMLGPDRLHGALRSFGLAEPTELGFPNEAPGALPDPSDWSGTSLATIAIGQGVAVSPLQMLLAYNVIANDGRYVAPSLVAATVDGDGVERPSAPPTPRQVITPETAAELNVMMRSVVETGTGQLAAIPGYEVAGKTGTAWKLQDGGGYEDELGVRQYQSTFIGFVPAQQPALSVYVMIDEPSGSRYTGGATAAPVFSKLGSFALRRLGIAPPATDSANGGAVVDGGVGPAAAPGVEAVGEVGEDGRVRALPAGTPVAPPSTVPHGAQAEE